MMSQASRGRGTGSKENKMSIHTLLIMGALVCFLLKAFGVGGRVDFMNLGFACLTATLLV